MTFFCSHFISFYSGAAVFKCVCALNSFALKSLQFFNAVIAIEKSMCTVKATKLLLSLLCFGGPSIRLPQQELNYKQLNYFSFFSPLFAAQTKTVNAIDSV